MPTEKRVPSLIVNTLTQAQYEALENPSDTEMWITPYDESILPDQTGQSGKYLTTNGSNASWATVDTLPSQTGQNGKFLTTDGTDASWSAVPAPAGVYTEDNLVAGTNISMTEETITGGIDSNALLVLHLNESLDNSSQYTGITYDTNYSGVSPEVTYQNGKFGKALETMSHEGAMLNYTDFSSYTQSSQDFTLEYWRYYSSTTQDVSDISARNSTGYLWYFIIRRTDAMLACGDENTRLIWFSNSSSENPTYYANLLQLLNDNAWNHIAICVKKGTYVRVFINGTLWYETTDSKYNTSSLLANGINTVRITGSSSTASYRCWFDEVRFSNTIRYTASFTPKNEPFSEGSTTVTKINNTQDISGKANVSLSNLTDAGNIVAAKASMPSSTYTSLTVGAAGATYTAPSDGYYFLDASATAAGQYIEFVAPSARYYKYEYSLAPSQIQILFPVKKGDIITLNYTTNGGYNSFIFIYSEGSKSEYV